MIALPEYLSLGVGVQSSTLAFMADCGEITPMPKAGIFGDTQNEPRAVYRWWEYLKANIKNFPLIDGTKGNLANDCVRVRRSANCSVCKHRHPGKTCKKCGCSTYKAGSLYLANSIPLFVKKPDGTKGILGRKCTRDYKIAIVQRKIKELLGLRRVTKKMGVIAVAWVGISFDEADRQAPSKVPWIENRWPLLEQGMTREDCKDWMKMSGKPEPPRSSCKQCPYHSDATWLNMKENEPEDFADAVQWERDIQAAAAKQEVLEGIPFCHDSLVTLDKVVFDPKKERDQFGRTCEGMCGV